MPEEPVLVELLAMVAAVMTTIDRSRSPLVVQGIQDAARDRVD